MSGTIFMIHGMWGSAWYWENYKRYFETRGYRCVATTLRHHDVDPRQAPAGLGTTSILDYIGDLEAEIAALGEKPIIMGHSMGGLLAQALAARGHARALVLLAPASPSGIVALTPSVIRSFWSVQTKWKFWEKPMRQTFNEAVYSMLHLLPRDQHQYVYDRCVHESGRAAFEIGYWPLDRNRATKVPAEKVTCPVLVVGGSEDRITPVGVVKKVAKRYPQATFKEFPRHAHWLVGEPGWEEVAGYAAEWLDRQGLS